MIDNYIIRYYSRKDIEMSIVKFCEDHVLNSRRAQQKVNITINYLCYNFLIRQRQSQYFKNRKILQFFINQCGRLAKFGQNMNNVIHYFFINAQTTQPNLQIINQSINLSLLSQINYSYQDNKKLVIIMDIFFIKFNYQIFSIKVQQFLINHLKPFKQMLKQQINMASLINLYNRSFIKIYLQFYINLLFDQTIKPGQRLLKVLAQINEIILTITNHYSKYIILYMFKVISLSCKSYEDINQKLKKVQNSSCFKQYINYLQKHFKQKLSQKIMVPPLLKCQNENNKILDKLYQARDFNLFQYYMEESINNQDLAYQILTFFAVKIYKKLLNGQIIQNYRTIINSKKSLNDEQNICYKRLLIGYIEGKVVENVNKISDFQNHLCLLNYLNMVVASRKKSSPLIQMFFDNGKIIKNYENWIKQRHLLFTITNPCYLKLKYLIQLKKKGRSGNSYTICSKDCHYITSVGGNISGNGSEGCAHLRHTGKCPICGGIIGGRNNIPTRSDSRVIPKEHLQNEQNNILNVKTFNFNSIKYEKKGYLINNLDLNKVDLYFKELRQSIIFAQEIILNDKSLYIGIQEIILFIISSFVWLFFLKNQLIKKDQLQRALNDQLDIENKLIKRIQLMFKQIESFFKFRQIKQYDSIWHFGISNILFEIIRASKNKHNNSLLLNEKQKIQFLNTFHNKIDHLRDQNSQKQFIIKNKNKINDQIIKPPEQTKQNFSIFVDEGYKFYQCLKQIEKAETFYNVLPQLKLYRLFNNKCDISVEFIIKYYQYEIQNYQFLMVYFKYLKEKEKYNHLKNIYTFISFVYQLCNHNITKKDLKKPIKSLFKQFQMTKQLKNAQEANKLFASYIKSWNYFSQNKYSFRDECQGAQNLGENLISIKEQADLGFFLISLDSQTVQSIHLKLFLQSSTIQYNNMIKQLQNTLKLDLPQYQKMQIISTDGFINPIQFQENHKLLNLSPDILKRLSKYSFYSLEYGNKEVMINFSQLQKQLAQQIIGLKSFISDKKQFKIVKFIGEEVSYIDDVIKTRFQISLSQIGLRQKIYSFFIKKYMKKRISFYKDIMNLQKILEKIIIYSQSLQMNQQKDKSLKQFIQDHRIYIQRNHNQGQLESQANFIDYQTINDLKIQTLLDLYDMVLYFSVYNIEGQIDPRFKKEIKSQLKKELLSYLEKMKKIVMSDKEQIFLPPYKYFQQALYLFLRKKIITQDLIQNQKLGDNLLNCQQFWCKQIKNKGLQNIDFGFQQILTKIKLSQTGDLLKMIPHGIKEIDSIKFKEHYSLFRNQ